MCKAVVGFIYIGYMWLDTKVPATVELILCVTEFLMKGVDPSQYFLSKENDKKLAAKLKKKNDVVWDKQAYVISTINDRVVRVAAKISVVKMVRNNRPESNCMCKEVKKGHRNELVDVFVKPTHEGRDSGSRR